MKKHIVLMMAVIAMAGLTACERGGRGKGPEITTPYSAVLLDNNQLYYGKLTNAGSRFPELTDVYYIQSQVNQRGSGCERWLPLWRVLSSGLSEAPDLEQRIGMIRQLIVMRMEMMFRPELSTVSDAVRKKIMLALESLLDFESWARMRELYGLSFEEASAVWVKAIDRLLPSTPA